MRIIFYMLALLLFLPISACSAPDAGRLFESYLWQKRLVLIFAPSVDHPDFQAQNTFLQRAQNGVQERDIVTWRIIHQSSVQTDQRYQPHLSTNPFYREYDVSTKDFMLILIGKDGEVKLRSDEPVSGQDLFALIDSMPMRQREMAGN